VFPGFGTLVNVATVLAGTSIGVVFGHLISERIRTLITAALGLTTLLIAALSVMAYNDPAWSAAVGDHAPVLIVLGSLVLGGVTGGLLRIEDRLESFGDWLRTRLGSSASEGRKRFIEGYVDSSMVFVVGPLTVLGALSEGLGRGSDQLLLKASLDGFASIAFAATFGWAIAASAMTVLVVQGSITAIGLAVGDVLPAAEVSALTTVGGLLLVGVALRLLDIKRLPVADFLPALVFAPALTAAVAALT
jgi:hypothetical protein